MKKQTKKIALCGVLGALSITFLLSGYLFPFATYVSPAIAAALLLIVVYEFGIKTGLTLYTAVSLLALMLVPDYELVFMFIFVFGLYTVIKMPLDRKLGKKAGILAKLVYINMALAVSYSVLLFVFPVSVLVNEFAGYSMGFLALLGHSGILSGFVPGANLLNALVLGVLGLPGFGLLLLLPVALS